MVCNQDTIGLSSPCSGGSSGKTMSNMWVRLLFSTFFIGFSIPSDFVWLYWLVIKCSNFDKDLKGKEMTTHKITCYGPGSVLTVPHKFLPYNNYMWKILLGMEVHVICTLYMRGRWYCTHLICEEREAEIKVTWVFCSD